MSDAEWRKANPERHSNNWRRSKYKSEFGITLEQYNEMFQAQEGRCQICRRHEKELTHGHRLVVDHCHKTGKVRGLLCLSCNSGLGQLQDSPEIVARALAYIS